MNHKYVLLIVIDSLQQTCTDLIAMVYMTLVFQKSTRSKIFCLLSTYFKRSSGQSIAEFAVITAMMATFVTTALPKYSSIMEFGKGNKSIKFENQTK